MEKTFFDGVYTTLLNELGSLYKKKEEAEEQKDILVSVQEALKEKISILNNQLSENASQDTYSNKIKNAERKFINTENIALFFTFVFSIINGAYFSATYESTKFIMATLIGTAVSTTAFMGLYFIIKDFIVPRIGRKDDETFDSNATKENYYDLIEKLELYKARLKEIENKIASSNSYIRLLKENIAIVKEQISDIENKLYPNIASQEKENTRNL